MNKQAHPYNIYDEDLTAESLKILSVLPNRLGENDLNHATVRFNESISNG